MEKSVSSTCGVKTTTTWHWREGDSKLISGGYCCCGHLGERKSQGASERPRARALAAAKTSALTWAKGSRGHPSSPSLTFLVTELEPVAGDREVARTSWLLQGERMLRRGQSIYSSWGMGWGTPKVEGGGPSHSDTFGSWELGQHQAEPALPTSLPLNSLSPSPWCPGCCCFNTTCRRDTLFHYIFLPTLSWIN